ncbi:hypothetical protein SAMN05444004_10898 [Jannaschia faecimaris]|uniref:Polyisoprenoid-binding protein YceI n=1 Tax=Jannaschia faecimaris TaxID=1244108 RepID=A0A1H3RFK3_9RHOB|nr:hypothetical protein [Jannaschia faecimaris]SDZ24426.1 hypothetical protein SAMN05444004_10898 [Jannaschia faecimaris]
MLLKTAALLTTLVGFAAPGHAQNVGELTLNLAGEEQVVPLWDRQSDWSGSENWPSINIYARAFNNDGEDPLVVTLSFDAPGGNTSRKEMGLSRYENGETTLRLFGGEDEEDGALSVTLESYVFDGSQLSLIGRVQGMLGTSENFGRDIDLSDAVEVEGTFAVTLEKLE